MKLYLASDPIAFKKLIEVSPTVKVLISYYKLGIEKNKPAFMTLTDPQFSGFEIFLDSGAFSAFTQGAIIDIDTYAEAIKLHKDRLKVYANLDVIGDPDATLVNQHLLEAKGLNPLPTFHFGSDIKYLEHYIQNYDYIALGGLVPYTTKPKVLQKWLDYCFSYILPHIPRVKIHGFGLSSLWAWKRYPFYSVDSTSWIMVRKFGSKANYKDGKLSMIDKTQNNVLGYQLSSTDTYYDMINEQARVYLKMAKDVTDLWKHRLGNKYYDES